MPFDIFSPAPNGGDVIRQVMRPSSCEMKDGPRAKQIAPVVDSFGLVWLVCVRVQMGWLSSASGRCVGCRRPDSPYTVANIIATRRAPVRSMATPTGRPNASSPTLIKPVRTSIGSLEGRPSENGTKITLYPLRGLRFHYPCWPMKAPCRYCWGKKEPLENTSPREAV